MRTELDYLVGVYSMMTAWSWFFFVRRFVNHANSKVSRVSGHQY